MYGVDSDGPLPCEPDGIVSLPETENHLSDEIYNDLINLIDPLRESNNYGIDIFLDVLAFCT